ncbi:MAG: carboxymuconolactone decarboxylase family protein, partial [Gammaproteobacteria bacterium]
MEQFEAVRGRIPDFAKDVRLNLDSTINRSSLSKADALGCALAAAYAAGSRELADALGAGLDATDSNAALTAAGLMGMNNVWYPYVQMADDPELASQRPELRMQAYASHGGVARERFEAFALAASIVGKCHFCVRSHYELLQKGGYTAVQLRDIGR